jgi:hypothetical protein
MNEKEFDKINKKLSRKQRLMLSFLSMPDDAYLPLEKRLEHVNVRHDYLVSRKLIDIDLFDENTPYESLEKMRRKISVTLRAEEKRLQEVAHNVVVGQRIPLRDKKLPLKKKVRKYVELDK